MKSQAISSPVERSGVQTETTFTIKATSKAFDILSSGLYSDKPQAIVRELCCNAYDAHVAAGKADVPIEVRLPTHLDPTFYVKDFGIGLDHEGVIGLYTTYFESTKQDSNDFIGALGLGSKSPFSYSSAFTVEARFDGTKRIYTAFKNESGMPSISLMGEELTEEPNGLTITLSIKKDDVEKFHNAAKKALMYFNPTPKVVGRNGFIPHKLAHTVVGNNWKIRESEYYAYMNGPYVVQGFVAYPIDGNILEEHSMSDSAKQLCCVDIDLFVPIGKVEVAASREALSYDKRTVQNLIAVLEDASNEMRKSFQAEFDACTTAWEAAILLDKYENNNAGKFAQIFTKMNKEKSFQWKGNDVTSSVLIDMSTVKTTTLTRAYNSNSGRKINYSNKWEPAGPLSTGVQQMSQSAQKYDFEVQGNLYIIIDTDSKGSGDILRQFLEGCPDRVNGHKPAAILIRPTAKNTYNQAEIDSIVAMFGNPPIKYVSQLGYTKTKSTSTYKKKDKAIKMVWKGFRTKENHRGRRELVRTFSRLTWTSKEVDMNAGGVYVPVERFTALHNGREMHNIDTIISSARDLGLLDKDADIVGLNEKEQAAIAGNDDWTNLFNLVKCNFEIANANNEMINKAVMDRVFARLNTRFVAYIINRWSKISSKFDDGEFKTYCQKVIKDRDSAGDKYNSDHVTSLASQLGIVLDSEVPAQQYIDDFDKMVKEYKMLQIINWDTLSHADTINMVIDYINTVQKS